VLENTSFPFSGQNAITLTDGAASGTSDSLTLSVAHGTLSLASLSGLTFKSGSNDTASMTVTGTLANLNAALNDLLYTPKAGYTGSDTLAITVANSLDGLSGTADVFITISPKSVGGLFVTSNTPDDADLSPDDQANQWAGVSAAVDDLYS
jgi:hypothetical protein